VTVSVEERHEEVHEGVPAAWTAVCPVSAIPVWGGVAALLEGDLQVAIFRLPGDELHALSNLDPFSGAAVLARGIVGDSGGMPVVSSPIYTQRFDLRTGVCLDDDSVRVATYPVRVVDGVVHVGSP
jgi:nitrite reductase (NADH) small subunit